MSISRSSDCDGFLKSYTFIQTLITTVPSRFMRKLVCILWLNEVSLQRRCFLHSPLGASYSYDSYSLTGFPQHNEAGHKPALTLSFHPEMCLQHGFCAESRDSDAQSYYLCESSSNAHWENRSRSKSRQCSLRSSWRFLSVSSPGVRRLWLWPFLEQLFTLLCMNCFQHLCHKPYLRSRDSWENVVIKMDCTTQILGLWKHFTYSFWHSKALVSDNEFYAI